MTSPRPPLLGQGLCCAGLAAALLGLTVLGEVPLLAGVGVLQLLLVLGCLALLETPASGGVFLVAVASAVAADLVVLLDDGRARALPGVVGLALVAGLLHQLTRRDRQQVVESLADTLLVVALVCMPACLVAARQHTGGAWPLRTALVGAGVALLAGRLGDRLVRRPPLAVGASRAWPGLSLALGAGSAAGLLAGYQHLPSGHAALIGLVAASTVAALDLTLDIAVAELPADETRRLTALRPVSVLLPFAGLGPVVLLVVRLLTDT